MLSDIKNLKCCKTVPPKQTPQHIWLLYANGHFPREHDITSDQNIVFHYQKVALAK